MGGIGQNILREIKEDGGYNYQSPSVEDLVKELQDNKNKQNLFDLLIKFGFTKTETDKYITFKNKDEIFAFPNSKLLRKHYIATRKQLDMNGWIDKEDFNSLFKFSK